MNTELSIKKWNISAKQLRAAVKELRDVNPDTPDKLLDWAKKSSIKYEEKDGRVNSLDQLVFNIKSNLGEWPSANDVAEILEEVIKFKEDYTSRAKDRKKLLANEAGATRDFRSLYTATKVQLQDWKIKTPNEHDRRLFRSFRQCGNSVVLVNEQSVLLCVEDAKGNIRIGNEEFLQGGLARIVKDQFERDLIFYVKKLNEFLIDSMDSNDESDSFIEDYIAENVPVSLMKLFTIFAYTDTDEDTGRKRLIAYKAELSRNIDSFSEIFEYVLNNWRKFIDCIYGQKTFYAWSNDATVTSSSYWTLPTEDVKCPTSWLNFMKEKMSRHLMRRFIAYIGMMCDASNHSQQYLIISDKGGTGKDFFSRIIAKTLPKNAVGNVTTNILANEDRFGLANCKIWETHLSIIHELNDSKHIMSEKAKQFFAQNPMDLEVKNAGVIRWEPINHKTMIFSNRRISIKEFANRRRAIPITFKNRLEYSEELEAEMLKDCRQFLDFCYCQYTREKLIVNGQYLVLSEQDESKFLEGQLKVDSSNADFLSKKAFSEECLGDYYSTDDYAESDMAIDVFDPFIDECLKVTHDQKDRVTSADFMNALKAWLELNSNVACAFNCKVVEGHLINFNQYSNSTVWKLYSHLEETRDVMRKVCKVNGKTVRCFTGCKLTANTKDTEFPLVDADPSSKFKTPSDYEDHFAESIEI
nr:MAG TPA: Parvovirus non-structural protein NS1 [Caudoviricetes sp.]